MFTQCLYSLTSLCVLTRCYPMFPGCNTEGGDVHLVPAPRGAVGLVVNPVKFLQPTSAVNMYEKKKSRNKQ